MKNVERKRESLTMLFDKWIINWFIFSLYIEHTNDVLFFLIIPGNNNKNLKFMCVNIMLSDSCSWIIVKEKILNVSYFWGDMYNNLWEKKENNSYRCV